MIEALVAVTRGAGLTLAIVSIIALLYVAVSSDWKSPRTYLVLLLFAALAVVGVLGLLFLPELITS